MNTAIAQSMLAWLLTYALHSTVLLSATWLALRGRRFAPAVVDVAWKAALVGGILTATVQGLAARRPAGSWFLGAGAASSAIAASTSDGTTTGTDVASALTGAAPREVVSPEARDAAVRSAAANIGTGVSVDAPAPQLAPLSETSALFAIGWLLVAFALVAWYTGRRLILVGRLGDRRAVVDGSVLATLEELRRDARARSAVRLTASATISSPVALGGEICLPAAAIAELDPAQLRAMLAHELAHLERRDPQWLAFACVLERAFFFQPLNRLARRGLQENAEYCADEWAAQHSGGVPLAKALVKVAEWIQSSPLGVPVAGFAEERSQLTVRVTRLLDGGAISPRSRAGAVAFASVTLMLTAAFAPGVAGGTGPQTQDPASRITLPTKTGSTPAAQPSAPSEPDVSPATSTDPVSAVDAGTAERISLPLDRELAFADTAIVRAVMLRLRDEDAEVRRAAADALGRMKHPMAIDALVIALDDLDGDVRRAAIYALGNFDHARVPAPPIRRMLDNADAEIRSHAVRMLADLRDRPSVPAITRLLSDENDEVRTSALQALNELEAAVPEEALLRALTDRSTDLRESAANLAGERQIVGVVPQLVKMLDDRSSGVRESAAHALTEMRTPVAHEALRKALTHKDANVRRIAVEYFGEEVDK